jgi:predicted permease
VSTRDQRAPAWRRYLRFWGHDPSSDLDDEFRFHLEARYNEYTAMGLDSIAARAEVERRFGDARRFRAQCARIDSQWAREQSLTERLHTLAGDVRYAARQLLRSPSLSIAAILCFALGIGANTSIFSVVDAVLFRPLPFADPDRLVILGDEIPAFGGGDNGTVSAAEISDYKTLNGRAFANSAIFENGSFVLSGGSEPERVVGTSVSASLFDVLGVKAARGRTFTPDEDAVAAPDVVVLSDALWRTRFGADLNVVGRSTTIEGRPFRIVGVMPRDFAFPLRGLESGIGQLFTPFKLTPDVERARGNVYNTVLIARLAPRVTRQQAEIAAADVSRRFPAMHPDAYSPRHVTIAHVSPLRDRAVGDMKNSLLLLLAAVGLVLLIACINVSSLFLARAASKQREFSVRRALGASRGRLLQQFVTESLLLVAGGAGLGVAFAVWGAHALAARAPGGVLQGYSISVDGRVLAFTAAVTIATALAVSIFPVLQQPEGHLASALRDEARGATGGLARQRTRRTLVVVEIALAVLVAVGAGLMVKSLIQARSADPGFTPDHLVSFRLVLPDYRYRSDADVSRAQRDILARLRAVPGARNASIGSFMPTTGTWHIAATIENQHPEKTPIVLNTLVFPGFFETLGVPIRAGASFDGTEKDESPHVAIVNQSFVKKYFPTSNPIGQRIKWGSRTSPAPWATIVGVSGDVRQVSLDRAVEPAVYMPVAQNDTGFIVGAIRDMAYVVRTEGAPQAMFAALRQTIHDFDPTLPIINMRTQDDNLALSVAGRRFNTGLLAGFALLALVLAAVGIYGLMSFTIVQRTREIGIRLAIGATQFDVLALVVGQGTRLAIVGVTIGLAGAFAFTRVMRSLLFDVSPFDPIAFIGAALLLLAVAALASYLPARRASRVDPQLAIRSE